MMVLGIAMVVCKTAGQGVGFYRMPQAVCAFALASLLALSLWACRTAPVGGGETAAPDGEVGDIKTGDPSLSDIQPDETGDIDNHSGDAGDTVAAGDADVGCGIPNLKTSADYPGPVETTEFRTVDTEICTVLPEEYQELSYHEFENACRLRTAWNGVDFTLVGDLAYTHVAADGVTLLASRQFPTEY